MYVPRSFEMNDPAAIEGIIRSNSFALLVIDVEGEPMATHLPLLYDPQSGPHGLLRGHLALANPQAELLAGRRALAIFSGPHAYISPTWYQTKNTVPTWNYLAVHAYGTCEGISDEAEVMRLLEDMVGVYESNLPSPWRFDSSLPAMRDLAKAIFCFQIPIDRLEAKAKLNQNHPPERRRRVIEGLGATGDPSAKAIAKLMEALG